MLTTPRPPRLAVLAALLATATLGGCTRTYNVARPRSAAELQFTVMANDAGVVTPIVAPRTAPASGAPAVPVPWGNSLTPSGDIPIVDLSEVQGYEIKRRGMGALEGFLLGTLGGGFLGFAVGASLGSDHCTPSDSNLCIFELSSTEKGIIGAVLAGMPGAVLGTIIGGLRGHTDRYLFTF